MPAFCPPNINPPTAFVQTMAVKRDTAKPFERVGMVMFLHGYDFAYELLPGEDPEGSLERGKALAASFGRSPDSHQKYVAAMVADGWCVFD